jgi:hypothetical protein
MMTLHRQKIAKDAVNACLEILYRSGEDGRPTIEEKAGMLAHLGAARAALSDHLWGRPGTGMP